MHEEAALQLYLVLGQQAQRYLALCRHFGDAASALAAGPGAWDVAWPGSRSRDGSWPGLAAATALYRAWPDGELAAAPRQLWHRALRWLEAANRGLWQATPGMTWPPALAALPDPPPLLFWEGSETALGLPQVALVGSRAATRYGLDIARNWAGELVQAGLAITSGLASGIDGAAHRGALARAGVTVAVMGCGLDRCYPPANQALMREIPAAGGLCVSEFVPGTPPEARHFPRRNVVISALSLAVTVIEAGPDSGSLITAAASDQFSRPVMVVPGSIHSLQSRGCHEWLKRGQAVLAETPQDVMRELLPGLRTLYGLAAPLPLPAEGSPAPRPSLPAGGQALLDVMAWDVWDLDRLAATSALAAPCLLALLGELEVAGWIAAVPGGYQQLSA